MYPSLPTHCEALELKLPVKIKTLIDNIFNKRDKQGQKDIWTNCLGRDLELFSQVYLLCSTGFKSNSGEILSVIDLQAGSLAGSWRETLRIEEGRRGNH